MLRRVSHHHQRRPHKKRFLPRFTFANFVYFVLSLVVLAYIPSICQRFTQKGVRTTCEWLRNPPMVCAHGGDSSRAPPNTLAAYQLALDAGVDCIEIDASRTRDGILVALHDRDLQRMSRRNGVRVGELSAFQINKLDPTIDFSGQFPEQRVLMVENAIQFVKQSLKQVIIDAKVGPPLFEEGLSAELIFMVKETKCGNCLVWAKEDKVVAEIIHQSAKATKTGYIVMNDTSTGKVSDLLRFEGAEVVGIYYGLANVQVVKDSHRAGKRVHAWTVNTGDAMISMLKAGVDAIITNDPILLQQVMREQKELCILDGFTAF